MNNLTTIASLPSGCGCKSALSPEVGKPSFATGGTFTLNGKQYVLGESVMFGVDPGSPKGCVTVVNHFTFGDVATASMVKAAIAASQRVARPRKGPGVVVGKAIASDPLAAFDALTSPDMLDAAEPWRERLDETLVHMTKDLRNGGCY